MKQVHQPRSIDLEEWLSGTTRHVVRSRHFGATSCNGVSILEKVSVDSGSDEETGCGLNILGTSYNAGKGFVPTDSIAINTGRSCLAW
jgi:hypothetical protein